MKPLLKLHPEIFNEQNKEMMKELYSDADKIIKEKQLVPYDERVLGDVFFQHFLQEHYPADLIKKNPLDFSMMSLIISHVYHFMENKKVYKLEKFLIDRLINTSLKKVDSIFVNSPYRSVFISIPGNTKLKVPNKENELQNCIGFYVYCTIGNFDMVDEQDLSKVIATEVDVKVLRICFVCESGFFYALSLCLKEGDVFEQYKDWLHNLSGLLNKEEENVDQLLKFALNTLLYLTSEDAMIKQYSSIYKVKKKGIKKKSKKMAKIDKRLQKYSKFSYYNVGEGLHEVLVSKDKPINHTSSDETRRTPIPHTVGGHWLTYWKGHGDNKKPVKKWRASYPRGSYKL